MHLCVLASNCSLQYILLFIQAEALSDLLHLGFLRLSICDTSDKIGLVNNPDDRSFWPSKIPSRCYIGKPHNASICGAINCSNLRQDKHGLFLSGCNRHSHFTSQAKASREHGLHNILALFRCDSMVMFACPWSGHFFYRSCQLSRGWPRNGRRLLRSNKSGALAQCSLFRSLKHAIVRNDAASMLFFENFASWSDGAHARSQDAFCRFCNLYLLLCNKDFVWYFRASQSRFYQPIHRRHIALSLGWLAYVLNVRLSFSESESFASCAEIEKLGVAEQLEFSPGNGRLEWKYEQ